MRQGSFILISASALATAACSAGQAHDVGPTVSKNYSVSGFTKIEVAGPFDVTVATGKAASVTAQGPQKLLDVMEVVVDGDVLKVRSVKKGWVNWGWNDRGAKMTITVPSLEEVRLAGSGDIQVDRVTGDRFSGSVAGSGDLKLGQVAVKELSVTIQGSGGSSAAGQADQARYSIEGSGDIDASKVTTKRAEASIAGSGDIRATAKETAKADIAGSGNITITGGAKCEANKRGSGEISCS